MQLPAIIDKTKEYIHCFREQLHKKDAEAITALTTSMHEFFSKLEEEFSDMGFVPHFTTLAECAKRFSAACCDNDVHGAAKALYDMELTRNTLEGYCSAPIAL